VRFCAVLFASLLASAAAQAYPLLSPHEVPSAIAGPSDAHVASMVQNPAAIGPLRGLHVYTEGAARFYSGSIAPDSAGHRVLIGWTNPEGFIGLTWDLLNDRIAIGFAVHSPFVELSSYSDPAVRYHEIWQRFATLEENVSFSLRLAKNIFVGGGANFDESWIDYEYVRDAAVYGGTNGLSDANGLCAPNPCGCAASTRAPASPWARWSGPSTAFGSAPVSPATSSTPRATRARSGRTTATGKICRFRIRIARG
jgi:hypothetical protein